MKSIKGEMVMDRELKGIVVEIFSLVILLIIAVPLCVRASSNYQEKKDKMYVGNHANVDINNLGSVKKVIVSSEDRQDISIYLMLKISKFDDEYVIYLDDKIFRLSDRNILRIVNTAIIIWDFMQFQERGRLILRLLF